MKHMQDLSNLTIVFVDAKMKGDVHPTTLFPMRIKTKTRDYVIEKSFQEFEDFRSDLLLLLEYGHRCHSSCPWLWMFVSNHFPRRHFFRSDRPKVIAKRQTQLDEFMQNVLQSASRTTGDCHIAEIVYPARLCRFLEEREVRGGPGRKYTSSESWGRGADSCDTSLVECKRSLESLSLERGRGIPRSPILSGKKAFAH
jgi:hypothetical protein